MDEFFCDEALESMYNILKGTNQDLNKSIIKSYIYKLKNIDVQDSQVSNKNEEHIKIMSYEEFKDIVKQEIKDNDLSINTEDNNSNKKLDSLLKGGFELIDSNEKGYIDINDIKKINEMLNMQFSEDDLEGLLEMTGKKNSKITLTDFIEFLTSEEI